MHGERATIVAVAAEVALGLLAAYLLVRPSLKAWPVFVAARWPVYAEAAAKLPKRTRRQVRRQIRRGRSVAGLTGVLGLASVEITARAFRAFRVRPRRRLKPALVVQYAVLPVLVAGAFVTGDRATRIACSAGFALLGGLVLYYVRLLVRRRLILARVARARAATIDDLQRTGQSPSDVRPLLAGPPGKVARPKYTTAMRRRRPLGGWGPIVLFVAAAILIGEWADGRAGQPAGRFALPADLRLPVAVAGAQDPFGAVFAYLSIFLNADGSNLRDVLARATPGERMTYVLEDVDEEIGNGGFEQLYWNPDGALVPDAIRYARTLGADSYAHALEVSTRVFPGGVVPASMSARRRIIGPFESKRPALTRADALWRERGYLSALRAYLRAHRSQFFR